MNKSEQKFSRTFHDNPIAMALINTRTQRYVDVNDAFAVLTGRDREDFVGQSPLDLDVWPGAINWKEIMQWVARQGEIRDHLIRFEDDSKTERVCLGSAKTIEVDGQPHILSTFLDITEHSHADEALHIQQADLEEAQHLAKIGSWQWDPRTRAAKWSRELYRIHGLDPALAPPSYEDLPRYFTAESWRKLREAMTISAKTGSVPAVDLELIRPDGTKRWVSTHGQVVRNASGEISFFRGTTQDITERKQTLDQLIESEKRFRLVADTAPVMIWMSGPDRMCSYVNKRWLDFTDQALGEVIGNGWWQAVHFEDLTDWQKVYTEMFDRKEPFTVEYRLRRHDGEYRWILNTGVPRFNGAGSFAGYIGSCIDVSEGKLAQQALADIGRRLIEAHEEERTWIARELHDDINQRLALLLVELERWSQQLTLTTESAEQGHRIQRRLSEIAKDVQHLSHRLHSSKLEYLGLAAAAKSFCKEISEENMVEVSFQHASIPKSLSKDISLSMFRVLQEALQNAVKHSGVRNFTVNLHGTPNEIVLTVSDAGKGFDEQAAIRRRGLGLISMRERIQFVNGGFSIKSTPGFGTTIHARIPLKTDEPKSLAG